MKNVPTWTDIWSFIRKNVKLIFGTAGIALVVFGLFFAYNLYSNSQETEQIEEGQEVLTNEEIEEILLQEPEEITELEISQINESLLKEAYTFSIFIENEDQDGFNTPSLLEEFLLTDEVVEWVENTSGATIFPEPEFAITVTRDSVAPIQYITIGTGDENTNRLIANSYYRAIEEDIISFLANKTVYFLDEEPRLAEEQSSVVQAEGDNPSFIETAVLGTVIFVVGTILGLFFAILKSIFQKEVTDVYGYQVDEEDTILTFNLLKNENSEVRNLRLSQTILYPSVQKKLVLSEEKISKEIEEKLTAEQSHLYSKEGQPLLTLVQDVSEVPPQYSFDEVVIVVESNATTKDWYQNQRIMLQNYHVPVKVLRV